MTHNALRQFLNRHGTIGIDTSIFIYQLEGNPKYRALTNGIFEWLELRGRAVTSSITMLELLVQPYRASDIRMVDEIYLLLSRYPNLDWIEPGLEIVDRAARLRAEHNLSTPDALQAATALAQMTTGFISNDKRFKRVATLDVLLLDDELHAQGSVQ